MVEDFCCSSNATSILYAYWSTLELIVVIIIVVWSNRGFHWCRAKPAQSSARSTILDNLRHSELKEKTNINKNMTYYLTRAMETWFWVVIIFETVNISKRSALHAVWAAAPTMTIRVIADVRDKRSGVFPSNRDRIFSFTRSLAVDNGLTLKYATSTPTQQTL